jgi:hypothetical protein
MKKTPIQFIQELQNAATEKEIQQYNSVNWWVKFADIPIDARRFFKVCLQCNANPVAIIWLYNCIDIIVPHWPIMPVLGRHEVECNQMEAVRAIVNVGKITQ